MPNTEVNGTRAVQSDGIGQLFRMSDLMLRSVSRHGQHMAHSHLPEFGRQVEETFHIASAAATGCGELASDYAQYVEDANKRWILTLDILRQRGDNFLEHQEAGCPPVLIYDYDVVVDGRMLDRPSNYQLLRITPPDGVEVHDWKRPYIIIDPRAGHGAGIGGFKTDSQVGVALRDGHPVYFVSFTRDPVPGQSLADVSYAEAEFVREVQRRHPDSAKPLINGNCQGGWATLLLAATNPDLTGPIVLNGAPVATWSGVVGSYPMRYNGGVLGGAWQPMLWSDIGGGQFDGAHLVMNFEHLNPSRNFFTKYYELFADPENGRQRFLDFERWWGGFFILNEAEIRWIVEQLFVGNRIVKNQAQLEQGEIVDVKRIKAPVIVFTSHGDNITPPQQALNWITDSYADEDEIRIRGQRILYMVHDEVGHLGIFVSSKIARKEHKEVSSTIKTIEALPPGLYEMKIDGITGEGDDKTFLVSFAERTLEDLRYLDDGREEEAGFAAVERMSEIQSEAYDIFARPLVRSVINPAASETMRNLHPLRVQRSMMSSRNPMMSALKNVPTELGDRKPVDTENPFLRAERLWASMVEQQLDLFRDVRDSMYELAFLSLWTNPLAAAFGQKHAVDRTHKSGTELRALPEVQKALQSAASGGFIEAVIRMLVLLAESRGNVRRDRLERSARILTQDDPFRSLSMDERARIIHEQTLIARFEPDRAFETLPVLLPGTAERKRALETVRYISGKVDEMAPSSLEVLHRLQDALGLPTTVEDILADPLVPTGSDAAER